MDSNCTSIYILSPLLQLRDFFSSATFANKDVTEEEAAAGSLCEDAHRHSPTKCKQ